MRTETNGGDSADCTQGDGFKHVRVGVVLLLGEGGFLVGGNMCGVVYEA